MTSNPTIKRALLSVSDKTGLADFARAVRERVAPRVDGAAGRRALALAAAIAEKMESVAG